MNTRITVGIPVYNAGKYAENSILSVLNQTLTDIELLVIDDHGTDDSINTICRVAASHPRGDMLRVVDYGENRGVAYARNAVIDEARGKYIFFMDQDDIITPNALELMYTTAEKFQTETVWGSYQTVTTESNGEIEGKECHVYAYPYKEFLKSDQLILFECRDLHENMQHMIWNILFLADFFRSNHLRFEQHGYFDDTIMHSRMQPLIQRAVLLPDVTYSWIIHSGSASNFQYRKHIKLSEATNAIEGSRVIIDHCKTLVGKSYFDVKCAKVMKQAFFTCCGILKHRHQMDGTVSNKQLKQWLHHPATFRQILVFRRYKAANLAFWLLGKLPANIMVAAIKAIGKMKGFL